MGGKNFPKKFAVLFARASTAVRSGIDPCAVRSSASKVVESMVPKFIRSRRILTPVLGTVQRIMRPMRIRPIRDTQHGGFAFVASICRVDHCTLYCLCLSNRLSCFFSHRWLFHICEDAYFGSVWAAPGTCRPTMPTQSSRHDFRTIERNGTHVNGWANY